MKTFAVTVDKTIYCITIIVGAVDCATLCKDPSSSNENYVELNVVLHQKSKCFNAIVCCLVVTRSSKQKKEFRITQNRGHKQPSGGRPPWPLVATAATCYSRTATCYVQIIQAHYHHCHVVLNLYQIRIENNSKGIDNRSKIIAFLKSLAKHI